MIKQVLTISVFFAVYLCFANETQAQYGNSYGQGRIYAAGAWGLSPRNSGYSNDGNSHRTGHRNYYGTNYGTNYGNYYVGGIRSNGYVSAYRYDPYVYGYGSGYGQNFGYQNYPRTYQYSTPQYFSMSPRGHSPRRYR